MSVDPRRVLFVVPSAFPIGGLATWLDTLLPDLDALGWETWLGLPAGRHSRVDEYLELHPHPRSVRFSNPTGTWLGRRRAVERTLADVAPALLVNANVVDVYAAISALRHRGVDTPVVAASIHTLTAGLFADLDRFAGAVDALVAPNELVAEVARTLYGFPAQRVLRGSYGVDVRAEEPPRCTGTRLDLLWIGRFEQEQKRVSDLPRILRCLDERGVEWTVTVAGAGPLQERLREQLSAGSWIDRVSFLGGVPPDRVRQELLTPGRVLLLTSRWELGPVTAWEAMGQGVVVAATSFIGSGREQGLVDGQTAVFFPVGDVAAAADALAACRDPATRTSLARNAWRMARDRYSRPRAAGDWDHALQAVASLAPRQPAIPEPVLKAGRLDRVLGLGAAEVLRRFLRWPVRHQGSGDEWPHTRGSKEPDEAFLERIRPLDRLPAVAGR